MQRSGGRRRFPARVYESGTEPDARFSLANERTFLAWIRTALATTAVGIGLGALHLPIQPGLQLAAAVVLLALGAVIPLLAWWTWMDVERALRHGEALPGSKVSLTVSIGIGLVTLCLLLGMLLR